MLRYQLSEKFTIFIFAYNFKRRYEIIRGLYFPLVYRDKMILYKNTPLTTKTTNLLFWLKEEHFYKLWL